MEYAEQSTTSQSEAAVRPVTSLRMPNAVPGWMQGTMRAVYEHGWGLAEPPAPAPEGQESMLELTEELLRLWRAVLDQADLVMERMSTAPTSSVGVAVMAMTDLHLGFGAMQANYAKTLSQSRGTVKKAGYADPAKLLQQEHGLRAGHARDVMAAGVLLADERYPQLASAVHGGSVSVSQAAAIARVIDRFARFHSEEHIAEIEESMTNFARGVEHMGPFKVEDLESLARTLLARFSDEQVEESESDQWALRQCTYSVREDGMVAIRALLPHAEGAAVMEFLDAHSSPKVRFSNLDDPNPTPVDDGDTRNRVQKMADGLVRAFQVAGNAPEGPTQSGAAPVLTVTIPASELDRHAEGLPAVATVQRTGEIVPAAVAARLTCHGIIQAAVTGESGEVLYLGRSRRLFSAKQKAALAITYSTCAVGDCDVPARWCESHHVRSWSSGGSTDIDGGVNVCNFHHHQIHQGVLTVDRPPGSKAYVIRRDPDRFTHRARSNDQRATAA